MAPQCQGQPSLRRQTLCVPVGAPAGWGRSEVNLGPRLFTHKVRETASHEAVVNEAPSTVPGSWRASSKCSFHTHPSLTKDRGWGMGAGGSFLLPGAAVGCVGCVLGSDGLRGGLAPAGCVALRPAAMLTTGLLLGPLCSPRTLRG